MIEELKVVILAAGTEDIALRLLEPLGEKCIIDYVVDTSLRFVKPKDIYIVVGDHAEQIQEHLDDKFNYVLQEKLLGTGDAVLQTADILSGYSGNLLILYGDSPLFRYSSILGMINTHKLKNADMTLFTTITDQSLPYGRILRDSSNNIISVIEHADASTSMHQIRELNLGAYVARANLLFPILQKMNEQENDQLRMTDVIHQMVKAGLSIESYQSHDIDEILGINTPADLMQAEFILQKRQFSPHCVEENGEIYFGTGGWRAIIGEGFTMNNVRRLCQALSNQIIRDGKESQGVLIGYDRRFLADRAAQMATEVFAGNNIPVTLLKEAVPTPLVTYVTDKQDFAYGLIFTASHNPPEWNGLKVFHQDGSLLLSDETNLLETEANHLTVSDVVRLDFDTALRADFVKYADFTNVYIDAVEALINMGAIREASLSVLLDPMYGTGQGTLETILTEARCRVTTIHGRHDPLFGGRSPAPNQQALGTLIAMMKERHFDLGMAMDGDADRIAIVDEQCEFIHINDILLLLYYYLHQIKGMRGGVVRNLATTHLLDRLAAHFGEKCIETQVGFKHIVQGMQEHDAVLGGESSGGLTIRGHILGKDGIFAAALIVEMLAITGKKISELRSDIYAITGYLYSAEVNFPATSEMKIIVPQRLQKEPVNQIGEHRVLSVSYSDGIKFLFENDNWLLLRFSGTEPVLRVFAEADSQEKVNELVDWAKGMVSL